MSCFGSKKQETVKFASHKYFSPTLQLENQSKILPGSESSERIRINSRLISKTTQSSENLDDWLISDFDPNDQELSGIKTCYQAWDFASKKYADRPCLEYLDESSSEIKYISRTYKQVADLANNFGSGLIQKCDVKINQNIGIYAQNSYKWTTSAIAANNYNFILVPLYDTLGDEALRHISNLCEFETIIIHSVLQFDKLMKEVHEHEKGRKIKNVVILKNVDQNASIKEQIPSSVEEAGINCYFFDDLAAAAQKGEAEVLDHNPPKPTDTFVINFTSGTTGVPKGVVQTHQSWMSNISVAYLSVCDFTENDCWFSYLPLAHVFERFAQTAVLLKGGRIGFSSGDTVKIIEEAGVCRPTIFGGVPRVWNKFYAKLQQRKEESNLKKKLIDAGLKTKIKMVKNGTNDRSTIFDKIIFSKLTNLLGGKTRIGICGAAPMKNEVMNTLRGALGMFIAEGYGQTECCAACCLNNYNDSKPSVGPPLPCNAIKLVSVPEMNYYTEKDQGEICIKGHNVMTGYYKNESKTKEAIDENGWLHTGDIGQWTKEGTLQVIDRVKNIFKTSLGEYIAPEKIENCLIMHPALAQAFVYGDGFKSKLVLVAMVDEATFVNYCFKNVNNDSSIEEFKKAAAAGGNGPTATIADLCENSSVKALILKELQDLSKKNGLKGFETVKSIRLHPKLMTVEEGLLTPTMKACRDKIGKYFEGYIGEMYGEIGD